MPAYGIAAGARGQKTWMWARKRLAASHNYWISTVHPDGRPNATAVWGVWIGDAFWFSCAPSSRKAMNLARDPRCTITTGHAGEAVIVEGVAAPIRGRASNRRFTSAYNKKYQWTMDPDGEGYFLASPCVAFAFIEHEGQFARTATRFQFAPGRPASRRRSARAT